MSVQPRPANWQPVFVELIQKHRLIHAIKLWAAVCRYTNSDGRPDLARAHEDIEAIHSYNASIPDGSEHPDLPEAELSYYRERPWVERSSAKFG